MNNSKLVQTYYLDSKKVFLRKKTTDFEALKATLAGYHRSPIDLNKYCLGNEPLIVDLGSNIGLTIVDYKIKYPSAKIIGVELDSKNFELCKKNIHNLTNCHLVQKAIWDKNGEIHYSGPNEVSYSVTQMQNSDTILAKSITIVSLIEEFSINQIDFLKIDIEGAEKQIFNSKLDEWLPKVLCLNVEIHDDPKFEFGDAVIAALTSHGFLAWKDSNHWSSITGLNKKLLYGRS